LCTKELDFLEGEEGRILASLFAAKNKIDVKCRESMNFLSIFDIFLTFCIGGSDASLH
jgi:hypothetical protein